jgi:hypothetical protein
MAMWFSGKWRFLFTSWSRSCRVEFRLHLAVYYGWMWRLDLTMVLLGIVVRDKGCAMASILAGFSFSLSKERISGPHLRSSTCRVCQASTFDEEMGSIKIIRCHCSMSPVIIFCLYRSKFMKQGSSVSAHKCKMEISCRWSFINYVPGCCGFASLKPVILCG